MFAMSAQGLLTFASATKVAVETTKGQKMTSLFVAQGRISPNASDINRRGLVVESIALAE